MTTDVFGLWLQSLDPVKVARESFHGAEHRAMLREHEARKRKVLGLIEEHAPLVQRYTPKRAQEKRVQRIAVEHEFTDAQLRIAEKVFSKKS